MYTRIFILLLIVFLALQAKGQNDFESKSISKLDIIFEDEEDKLVEEQFRPIIENSLGKLYSTVKIRHSLQELYNTGKILWVKVEANHTGNDSVALKYIIKLKQVVEEINIKVGKTRGEKISEDELLSKANFLSVGSFVNEQTLKRNADSIQNYLRERGFYNAEVSWKISPGTRSKNQVKIEYEVNPNEQARIEEFKVLIKGLNSSIIEHKLKLRPGEFFSNRKLDEDVARIKEEILKKGYLAPTIDEPKVTFDPDTNKISIEIRGNLGPQVEIKIQAGNEKIGETTQRKLLPVKREGTLEQSAIIEGARRLRNHFQEKGYFFAQVRPVCVVTPEFSQQEIDAPKNYTESLCGFLSGANLENRKVEIIYRVNLNRKLNLREIRIEGTDKIKPEDVLPILETQTSSLVGLIPNLGYGRGYTSNEILENDRQQIETLMYQLGYRRAKVRVRQGVSIEGDDLIVTFVVEEGPITRISEVEISGNQVFSTEELKKVMPQIEGKALSPARLRNALQEIAKFYSNNGYFDTKISYRIIEMPESNSNEEKVKVVYEIEKEGKQNVIGKIFINGNESTDNSAILKSIRLKSGALLKSSDIIESEQNLYASDAFKRVEIKAEEAGENAQGQTVKNIIINLEEEKPRDIQYGGGFSTDTGAFGFINLRHTNLFGKLQQGGFLARVSRLQQLFQLDFFEPRLFRESSGGFSPLRFTAQYQRDSTVTRFFRSAFDRGTFGIVQRLDPTGNPIDTFGNRVENPMINRLNLMVETQKEVSRAKRSFFFLRYRFEKVDLLNTESLLIKDLLEPDSKTRISGFGFNFILDTRRYCSKKQSLLEFIQKGDVLNPCRYNPAEPTNGQYLAANYDVSIPFLGANIGFQKFQLTYQTYYTSETIKSTFAGRLILGAGKVFYERSNRFSGSFSALSGILPISERFFAGGSTTLRGFDFEAAGPRIVTVPTGIFRTSDGRAVSLLPFTTPLGGNALAVLNLELRMNLSNAIQAVPFYDGGNVFRSFKDILKPPTVNPSDVLRSNLQATWTNTIGLGLRIKTPIGGSIAFDFGYLLNPPKFLIPQTGGSNAIYRLKQNQLHFRLSQTF
ncbi:MAG: BamA/TamA family outer membrane protein [Pyrinomonadaceae bacterium]|nr:BamA/TamA family outer membrane protein [Pyrinomonadaceae bacterium]MCX7639322.1 BamA/TamA family outer membrane protein [Pyrinomonadaceae bacterium]MDW8303456.1 POTRA domain-containing protein [Acidobacteriota bacterium]